MRDLPARGSEKNMNKPSNNIIHHNNSVPFRVDVALLLLLVIGWALVLFRMWGGGFTGGDEGFTASAAYHYNGVFGAAKVLAESQGRFYQLFIFPLAQIPYLFDSLAWTNSLRILSSASAVIAFYYFTQVLFGRILALLSGFILLALQDTVGSGYNPFHALPLWFNLGITLFFFSLYLFTQAVSRGKPTTLAYTIFFTSLLTYEAMLLYALAFVLLWLHLSPPKKVAGDTWRMYLNEFRKNNIGLFVSTGSYLLLYAIYRMIYGSSYAGAQGLSWSNTHDVLYTVYAFSVNGIYIRGLRDWFWDLSLPASHISVIVAVGMAFCIFLQAFSPKKTSGIISFKCILSIVLFIFIPNILFGLTERYRGWATKGPYYIGSYFSSFAICLALAVAIVFLLTYTSKKLFITFFSNGIAVLLASSIAFGAYLNHYQSVSFFDKSRNDARRSSSMAALGDALHSRNIGPFSTLCITSLMADADPYDYWSFFISKRAKYPVKVMLGKTNKKCEAYIEPDGTDYKLLSPAGKVIWSDTRQGPH
ncbi:hypothetical protein PQR63_12065 [Herbaspirillum rhizosphaerae]|uniref:Glycosyltransferase RgtA/B/C/D-like domain-containing protein n=1 Tax=Herbaspirillum rhizosphaerae TaxID=346179 RepID=A0ABW8Z9G2_9BURK